MYCIKDMYEDVNEPIRALTEERKRETEEEQKSREAKLNRIFVISFDPECLFGSD